MTKTLSGIYSSLYTLSGAADNPTTITAVGLLNAGLYAASLGSAWMITNSGSVLSAGITLASAGTVVNAGSIAGTGTAGNANGVQLQFGGYVSNAASATISAIAGSAVYALGASGTFLNAGLIENVGTVGSGIHSLVKSSVSNAVGGTIAGYDGVYINGGGTALNAGLLKATGSFGYGVLFQSDGYISNYSTGTISGTGSTFGGGIRVNGVGTVVNFGSITGIGPRGNGVFLFSGSVTNSASASITGGYNGVFIGSAGTVVNYGSITSTDTGTNGSGVDLHSGGSVTNEASGSIITGDRYGVVIHRAIGSVINHGSIASTAVNGLGVLLSFGGSVVNDGSITGSGTGGDGIDLSSGGSVINEAAGAVTADSFGVIIHSGPGSVVNYGGITSTGINGIGVLLKSLSSAGLVVNFGSIRGTGGGGDGVDLASGGSVTNEASGSIAANSYGVLIHSGAGTVVNDGSIGSSGGTAVKLAAGFANAVMVNPGAVFSGTVDGGNIVGATAVSTLELASGASAGTLSGLGSQYVNFAQTTIDAGAYWKLLGTNTLASGTTLTNFGTLKEFAAGFSMYGLLINSGIINIDPSTLTAAAIIGSGTIDIGANSKLTAGGTVAAGETIVFAGSGAYLYLGNPASVAGSVTNFDVGETILLKGVAAPSVNYAGGVLSFAGGSFALSLAGGGTPTVSSGPNGAEFSLLCFCADTRILTPSGERRVQELAVGDMVTTHRGEVRRIEWIGAGKVLATRGRRNAATPVIVCKGALADNVPCRDLRVTKGHSLYLDDVLIPVEFLVNHRSILWDDRAQEVTLYHIELETHDVLVADGAPAESYRDDGNRWLFQNANAGWALPPQAPCAPILTGGPLVDAVWRRLLERAGPRPGFLLTDDPDLHLLVDGMRLEPVERRGSDHAFRLTAGPAAVRIVSRAAAPAELGLARDPRVLGVALRQIVAWQGARCHVIASDDAALGAGFYPFEPDNGLRWTDGDAALPVAFLEGFDGPMELVLHLGATTQYPLLGEAGSCAAA